MNRPRAEEAVVQAILARGYLSSAQVEAALAASGDGGVLAKLSRRLDPAQVEALRVVYEAALSPEAERTLPPSPGPERTLPPSRGAQGPLAGTLPPTRLPVPEPAAPTPVRAEARELRTLADAPAPTADRPERVWLPERIQPLQVGERLGPYLVERELARGGMGAVYVARHTSLPRQVALKVMLAPARPGSSEAERFLVEARAAASLRHPGIVIVHDVGVSEGRSYMAMELVQGESLSDLLARAGPLDPIRAAEIALEVARALDYAHEGGVLHRDMKPSNVLVAADGRVLLTDFGLAQVRGSSQDALTRSGEVMGTPAYMSPEQAVGKAKHADPRTDVYGLGATLYAMLTGVPPFAAQTMVVLLATISRTPPTPPSSLRGGIPAALEAVCLKCLEKLPQARYASASELAADLERFLEGERVEAPSGRVRWMRWALVALLVSVVIAGAWRIRSLPSAAPVPTPAPTVALVGAVPTSTTRRAAPAAQVPRHEFRANELIEGPDWFLCAGMTPQQAHARFLALRARGRGVTSTYAYGRTGRSRARVAMVWGSTDTDQYWGMTQAEVEALGPRLKPLGKWKRALLSNFFRDPTINDQGKGLRLRLFGSGGAPSFNFNRDVSTFRDYEAAMRGKGMILDWVVGRWVYPYPLSGLWRRGDPASVKFLAHLPPPLFAQRLIEEDGHLKCVGEYGDGPVVLNAPLWIRDDREGLLFHGQGPDAFRGTVAAMTADGFRPLWVMDSGELAQRLFTSSWVRESNRRWRSAGVDPLGLEGLVRPFMEAHGVARAALAVVAEGQLRLATAYTWAPAAAEETQPWSRFRCGSISTLLTAGAVLRRVEQGRLRLDQPLSALVPWFSSRVVDPRARQVTLGQLLGHRSGWSVEPSDLAAEGRVAGRAGEESAALTRKALLRRLSARPLAHAPGAKRVPFELGSLLLAEALETEGETTYGEIVETELLGQVEAGGVALGRAPVQGRLLEEVGYDAPKRAYDATRTARVVPEQYGGFSLAALGPARGWVAAAPQLARVVRGLVSPTSGLLEPQTRATVVRDQLGWTVEGSAENPRLSWTARMPGTFAHVERLPGGTLIVLLLNRNAPGLKLVSKLRDRVAKANDWPEQDLFERF